jgi:pyruvate,water dikinase
MDRYLTTINGYVYMHLSLGGRDLAWVLFRMVPAIPRLLRDGERHWREVALQRYARATDVWHYRSLQELPSPELLSGARQLTAAMAGYLTALQVDALGTAAGTEGLFTAIYERMVRGESDPPAPALLLGLDIKPIQAEKALYDLALWCRERSGLEAYLLEAPSKQLATQLHDEFVEGAGGDWPEWQRRFRAHLDQYGHSIYDLDFAKPLPADDPLPLLKALKMFIRGEGVDPHVRQQASADRREEAVRSVLDRVKGVRRWLFRTALRWAQTFALVREDSIFDIGLAYPALRGLLSELGRRCAEAGAITEASDIYWLRAGEVEGVVASLERHERADDLRACIRARRSEWNAQKRLTPPQQLPPKQRVLGMKTDAFMAASADEQTGDVLTGVAASPGRVTATARVLLGPEDFDQMRSGDVLVADITTPAWTPLFALASAVVTDIGGPLSHGSIVAREYGIPAVLGTGVATQRIASGQLVTVDGSAGTVDLAGR